MNRCPVSLSASKAIDGFVKYKAAEGLSPRTISSYVWILEKWVEHRGDHLLAEITTDDLRDYLAWLRTDYQPHRFSQKTHPLSAKPLRNIWVTFSAFFGWASSEFKISNPVSEIPAPRFQVAPIEPFTKEEVEKMLKACLYARERRRFCAARSSCARHRPCVTKLCCLCCWILGCAPRNCVR